MTESRYETSSSCLLKPEALSAHKKIKLHERIFAARYILLQNWIKVIKVRRKRCFGTGNFVILSGFNSTEVSREYNNNNGDDDYASREIITCYIYNTRVSSSFFRKKNVTTLIKLQLNYKLKIRKKVAVKYGLSEIKLNKLASFIIAIKDNMTFKYLPDS